MQIPPLVSCLCITYNRLPYLQRAVECFRLQTYSNRELCVLYQAGDTPTREYLESLEDPRIRISRLDFQRPIPFGALRNHSLRTARGEYFAIWDDDDWSAPERLALQMDALRATGKAACLLARVHLYDEKGRNLYVSAARRWEASIVARIDEVPGYPEVQRTEDSRLVDGLWLKRKLLLLDRPDLYYYVLHGNQNSGAFFADKIAVAKPAPAERIPPPLLRPLAAFDRSLRNPLAPEASERYDFRAKAGVLLRSLFG
jgi:glycosyltransferase involved in cell wall biosynthesis